jgi:hypothetical protein
MDNWTNVLFRSGNNPSGGFYMASVAHTGSGLHFVGLRDADPDDDLWYFAHAVGLGWLQPFKIRTASFAGPQPSKFANAVACASVGNDLHVLVTTEDGRLFHTIRFGTEGWEHWQQFGDLSAAAGGVPAISSVTCTGHGQGLLVVALDRETHTIWRTQRDAGGDWTQWSDAGMNPEHDDSLIAVTLEDSQSDGVQLWTTWDKDDSVRQHPNWGIGGVPDLKATGVWPPYEHDPGWRSIAAASRPNDRTQLVAASGDGFIRYSVSNGSGATWLPPVANAPGMTIHGAPVHVSACGVDDLMILCGTTNSGRIICTQKTSWGGWAAPS